MRHHRAPVSVAPSAVAGRHASIPLRTGPGGGAGLRIEAQRRPAAAWYDESVPFTLAHPAAVLPLRRPLGRLGVLSALVAGSMSPDLAYFLPLGVSGRESHSIGGLFWFCLPAGALAYAVFHVLLKRPLMSLLPAPVVARLWTLPSARRVLPAAPWIAVALSVLAGAVTHVVWDVLTHDPAAGIALLRRRLFVVGDYPVQVHTVLQHGSTVAGLLVLGWSIRRWARAAAPEASPAPPMPAALPVPAAARAIVLALILVTVGLVAGASAAPLEAWPSLSRLQRLAGRAVTSGLSALGLALLVWSAVWHAGRRAAARTA